MIRVLLVDGDAPLRATLAHALDRVDGLEVVGQVGDGALAASAVLALNPDVVVMAARLPVLPGPEAAARVAAACPQARLLALGDAEDSAALAVMRLAGAVGTITRDAPLDDIAAAILSAVACA